MVSRSAAVPALVAALLVLVVSVLPVPAAGASASAAATTEPSDVRIAVANLREGSLVRHGSDDRDGTDRQRFADRALGRGRVPDVVLAQEVLGNAARVVRALNRDPRAQRAGARYAAVTSTWTGLTRGRCDGPRSGRFRLLRGSVVVVNRATVTSVAATGAVRTWGRWHRVARPQTGRRGHGCSAHPWARLTVRTPGAAPQQVLAASMHIAPVGRRLKTRAIAAVRDALEQQAARPAVRPLVVLGGDLNLNRCDQPKHAAERRACAPRPAHRRLLEAGYRDLVRHEYPTGPMGVAGVSRRVDFLYVTGLPTAAWWDRCYRAYLVERWRCTGRRTVFATGGQLHRCQRRSLHHGSPGDGCTPRQFRRYYSDHPVILGTVRAG